VSAARSETVRLSRAHYPVTALGPGRRIGVWFQGCSLGCAGCLSRDTWDTAAGVEADIDDVLAWIDHTADEATTGITISGGEPSEQRAALTTMLSAIRMLQTRRGADWDVLCYTGYEMDEFLSRIPLAVGLIDVLMTGRFRITEPTDLLWRGSANQQLVPLTERGRIRYADYIHASISEPAMQVTVRDGQIWMVGIPRRGDLLALERRLRESGVTMGDVSWRP
jgi:anaerobic ribonucleoside-triphosphate reductase activating protein